jgi:hypothetical protein
MKNLTPLTLSTSNFSPFGIMKSILRAYNGKVIFLRTPRVKLRNEVK